MGGTLRKKKTMSYKKKFNYVEDEIKLVKTFKPGKELYISASGELFVGDIVDAVLFVPPGYQGYNGGEKCTHLLL